MNEFRYIAVDGLIGSGKTSLAQILAEQFNARLICDNQENPFLPDFFSSQAKDEESVSLKTQLIFLLNRYSQQLEIKQKGLFHRMTVSDYIFFRDGIYAHLILNDEELEIYKKMFNLFLDNVIHPDLVVYLQISFSEMLKRIQENGTKAEKDIPQDYWREVFEAYNYYFFNFNRSPLLVVNMEKVNLKNHHEVQQLVKEIKTHEKGTRYYAPA